MPVGKSKMERNKTFKVAVFGFPAVGKSALVVRFITRRFIGEYHPTLEGQYNFTTSVFNEALTFQIRDTAGWNNVDTFASHMELNVKWADAFILMYSVTDRQSFDDCLQIRFLIQHHTRKKRNGSSHNSRPVGLVGNKVDLTHERTVSFTEGKNEANALGCNFFREISVRESSIQSREVFESLYQEYKFQENKYSHSNSVIDKLTYAVKQHKKEIDEQSGSNGDEEADNRVSISPNVPKILERMLSLRNDKLKIQKSNSLTDLGNENNTRKTAEKDQSEVIRRTALGRQPLLRRKAVTSLDVAQIQALKRSKSVETATVVRKNALKKLFRFSMDLDNDSMCSSQEEDDKEVTEL